MPNLPIYITIACAFLAWVLMYVGWRRRTRRDAGLRPHTTPALTDGGSELTNADVFYVATTEHGKPFERLAIAGLRFRGRAGVFVSTTGITLSVAGEKDVFVPVDALVSIEQATWAIDRIVEKDGLVMLAWMLPDATTVVDSYLRIVDLDDRARIIAAIRQLISASPNAAHPIEEEA